MTTLVYQYGLLAPAENAEVIADQLRLAHRYRNTLTEIERGRRAAIRLALGSAMLDVERLERDVRHADERCADAARRVKASRSSARARSESASDRDALKAAKACRKATKERLRDARHAAFSSPEARAEIDRIDALANDLAKNARRYSGLGRNGPHCGAFGTYQLVEDAAFVARKTTPLYDGAEPNDPGFVRRGDARAEHVSVQITGGGVAVRDVTAGAHGYVAIADGPRPSGKPGTQPHLRLRLSDGGGRSAPDVWGSWPIILHRPLPPNAIVKRATATARRVGPRTVWTAEFTLDIPDAAPAESCGDGAVAVDLGWTILGDRIRVATWCDEWGTAGALHINARLVSRFLKVDDLRSIRDKNFDDARDRLVVWLHGRDVPEWLHGATRTLADWRSPARLAGLVSRWSHARFEGDADVMGRKPTRAEIADGVRGPGLLGWAAQDRHLWEWESSQRRAILFERREVFRLFAVEMSRRYGRILVPAADYSVIARRAPTEAERGENDAARRNRMIAAVGELRLAIEQAAKKRGATVERMSVPIGACPACGAADRAHVDTTAHGFACIGCGYVGDRDKAQVLAMLVADGKAAEVKAILARAKDVARKLGSRNDNIEGETHG